MDYQNNSSFDSIVTFKGFVMGNHLPITIGKSFQWMKAVSMDQMWATWKRSNQESFGVLSSRIT